MFLLWEKAKYLLNFAPLKTESRHDVDFVVFGGNGGCQNDNSEYRQEQHCWHHDNSRLSVS